jgi:hypothetical protein
MSVRGDVWSCDKSITDSEGKEWQLLRSCDEMRWSTENFIHHTTEHVSFWWPADERWPTLAKKDPKKKKKAPGDQADDAKAIAASVKPHPQSQENVSFPTHH